MIRKKQTPLSSQLQALSSQLQVHAKQNISFWVLAEALQEGSQLPFNLAGGRLNAKEGYEMSGAPSLALAFDN